MGDRAFSLPQKGDGVEITLSNAGNLGSIKGTFVMADMLGGEVVGYIIETPGEFGEIVTNYFNYAYVVGLSWNMLYEPPTLENAVELKKEAAAE